MKDLEEKPYVIIPLDELEYVTERLDGMMGQIWDFMNTIQITISPRKADECSVDYHRRIARLVRKRIRGSQKIPF